MAESEDGLAATSVLVSHGPCPSIGQEDQPVHGAPLQVSVVVSILSALEMSPATTVPSPQLGGD